MPLTKKAPAFNIGLESINLLNISKIKYNNIKNKYL